MSFEDFNLDSALMKGIKEAGYDEPTEVQIECIPHALKGKDIIVQSRTGSGKTAGFGIPILEKSTQKGIEAIVLVPTRELAMQVSVELDKLGTHTKSQTIAVYGGTDIQRQIKASHGKDIIVATPGRFIDLFKRGVLKLNNVKTLVLDEADRMLDMGFEQDIRYILSNIPKERQTLMFSATMPAPIQRIAQTYMRNPEKIMLSKDRIDVSTIEQTYYGTSDNKKLGTLVYALEKEKPTLAIVFCNRKKDVDWVSGVLKASGHKAIALHGDMTQNRRDFVIQHFKDENVHVLVASDVAARGLDINKVSHVINYDLPDDPDVYVHRIGRTGRAGKVGKAISIVTMSDSRTFDSIRRKVGRDIEAEDVEGELPKVTIPPREQRAPRRSGGGGPRRFNPRGPKRSFNRRR